MSEEQDCEAAAVSRVTQEQERRIEYRSLRDITCDNLREAIISGEYAPGERLKERELAQAFGVSTTPVKQALQRLELEGLVVSNPLRGSIVSEQVDSLLAETGFIRAVLEGAAAYLAALKATDSDIKRLKTHVQAMRDAANDDQPGSVYAANAAFHEFVHEMSRNFSLHQMATIVRTFGVAMRTRVLIQEEEVQLGLADHVAIADAIASRDPSRSEDLMRRHVVRTVQFLERERPDKG